MLHKLYEQMYLIRCFEEKLYDLFSQGVLHGTTHAYIGQEANAVAVLNNIDRKNDVIFSNHRCHGHYLAYNEDVLGLLAEIMGREIGICGGRGGSQHICKDNFYSNGILGGTMPNAAGMALAEKLKGNETIAVAFIGDGTLGEGIVYETLNMISLWEVPLLIICENNLYSQSTSIGLNLSGKIIDRAKAFGIEAAEITSTDVEILNENMKMAVNYVRSNKKPFFQIINTYRFCSHSKNDDARDEAEIEEYRKRDPLLIRSKLDAEVVERIEEKCVAKIEDAYQIASKAKVQNLDLKEVINY